MSIFKTLSFIASHPLNHKRKARSILNFVRWQIASRMIRSPIVHPWINGTRFIVNRGETGLTGNVYCVLHEFADMSYVLHAANNDDLFVDIGANVGSYTILACAARGAKGICFEPVPATFERLMANIRINDLTSKVCAMNLGLADAENEIMFTAGENCTNHALATGEKNTDAIGVKVVTLDSAMAGRSPTIMKIDVEGFELPVLRGAEQTLANRSLHSIIIECNGSGRRYGFEDSALVDILRGCGFSPYSYEPFSRRLDAIAIVRPREGNILFIRNADTVRRKIAAAPAISINGLKI